jgi:hypothetical protein
MSTTALILERILLAPEFSRFRGWLQVNVSAHQPADAASASARAMLSTLGQPIGVAASDAPEWVRLGLLDALARYINGTAETCVHGPSPQRPGPVLAAAWFPDRVVCARCPHLLSLPRGSAADRTCDLCGCDPVEPVRSSIVQFGPMLYQFATCADCRPAYPEGR